MSGKLKNIKALQEMLAGEHKTQTKSSWYIDKDNWKAQQEAAKVVRKVGDRWTEEIDGRTVYFEQKEGYRERSSTSWEMREALKQDRTFQSCPKEKCTCIAPTRIDEKFKRLRGMCLECVTAWETKLKIEGKFDEYAKDKMLQNAKSYFRDMEQQLEEWKRDIRSKTYYANGDATIESWQMENPEGLIEKIEAEYNELKAMVLNSSNFKSDEAE